VQKVNKETLQAGGFLDLDKEGEGKETIGSSHNSGRSKARKRGKHEVLVGKSKGAHPVGRQVGKRSFKKGGGETSLLLESAIEKVRQEGIIAILVLKM